MKQFQFSICLLILALSSNGQQPVKTKLPAVSNPITQQVLSKEYETANFTTVLSIIIHRGRDDMRNGQRLIPSIILTDGNVVLLKQNDIPIMSDEIFSHTGGYNGLIYNKYAGQARIGSINNIRFDGKPHRVHAVEVVYFEENRPPAASDDNFDIDSVVIKYDLIDKKSNRVVERGVLPVRGSKRMFRLTGSGMVISHIVNSQFALNNDLNREEVLPPLKFKLLNGGDGMKPGFSAAKLLVELKTGGVLEADISGATRSYSYIVLRSGFKVRLTDIRRIGIRYIYPSNPFDRDDWVLKGIAVEYDSFYKGPFRIYTNWDLNQKFNGDGQGTTWWSPVITLNL